MVLTQLLLVACLIVGASLLFRRFLRNNAATPTQLENYPAERLVGPKRCTVTVGTTEFEGLIKQLDASADDVCSLLQSAGFNCLTLQIGRGVFRPERLLSKSRDTFTVECFRLVRGLNNVIANSALVISHAGSSLLSGAQESVCSRRCRLDSGDAARQAAAAGCCQRDFDEQSSNRIG